MNNRSCLCRLRGALVNLNNKLLKMESDVSDSRSIGSQAHMRREGFHSRTKSDFPAASPLRKL